MGLGKEEVDCEVYAYMLLEIDSNYPFETAFNLRMDKREFIIGRTVARPDEYFRVRIKR
jgi:hypothetical protein